MVCSFVVVVVVCLFVFFLLWLFFVLFCFVLCVLVTYGTAMIFHVKNMLLTFKLKKFHIYTFITSSR